MKTLKDFINESIHINESNPRGDFKVKKPFPTDFMWEYYAYVNDPSSLDEPELIEDMVKYANFEAFLAYAEKNKWKKEKNGYYVIPKGTTLTFNGYVRGYSHIGEWEINNDGVYLTMTYDEVQYGDYDAYLKEI